MSLTSAPVIPCSCADGWRPEGWAYCAECYEGQIERLRAELAIAKAALEKIAAGVSFSSGVRNSKVCGYHDGCPPDGPVCHLCEHLQPHSESK